MDQNFIVIISIVIGILIFVLHQLIFPVIRSEKTKNPADLFISQDDVYEQVRLSIKSGNHPAAQKLAKKYLRENPNHDKLRVLLARSYYDTNALDDAIEHLAKLVKIFPERTDLQLMLANAYKRTEQVNNAIDAFMVVLDKQPDAIDVLAPLAELYNSINHKKSALNIYKRLANFDISDSDKAYYNYQISSIYKDFTEYDNAIEYINFALTSDKNNTKYLYFYRELCSLTNNKEKEIEIMNKLLVLAPNDAHLQLDLVNLYYKNAQYSEALDIALPSLNTPNADIQSLQDIIANIYIKTSRIEEGIQVLENILKQYPESIRLTETLAYAYRLYGRYEESINLYKRLVDWADVAMAKAYNSQLSSVYCDWALHLYNLNRNEDVFQKFEESMRINPDNPDIYDGLAKVNFYSKNYTDAIRQIQKAIDLDSNNSEYYSFLADVYKETDNIYEAERFYRESLAINPKDPECNAKLGIISLQLKNIKDALKHLEIAIKSEPNNWDYLYNLALAYELSGKNQKAIESYNRVLELYPEHKDAIINLKMLNNSR